MISRSGSNWAFGQNNPGPSFHLIFTHMKRYPISLRQIACGLLALCLGPVVQAQSELSPFFMPRSAQTTVLNPAASDGGTVSIALPSPSILVSHSGFGFGDLIQQTPGGDSTFLAVGSVLPQLGDRNRIQAEMRADLLNASIGIRNFRLLIGANSRMRADLTYPKDLIQLAWNGNAGYLDEALNIGPGIRAMAWQEVYAGAQAGIGDRIKVGGKLKYLSGTGYIGTSRHDLSWTTNSETYAWQFDLDYQLNTAGLDLGDISADELVLSPEFAPAIFEQNHGVALDVGILFKPIDKLELGFSAVDVGQISWKGLARTYEIAGSVEFDGVDVSPLLKGDSLDFDHLPDSLLQQFDLSETEAPFSTALPARYNVTAAFEPMNWLRVSTIFQAERYQSKWNPALAVGAQLRAGKWLDFGLSWMARDGQWDIIGLQTSVRMGPVVAYLMSDHILAPLRADHAQMAHLRLGMNLQFGYKK